MRIRETPLAGAFVIDIDPHEDERGYFARTYCAREFAEHGISFSPVQCNLSRSHRRGTVRGLHYQVAPAEEPKLIRCERGGIYDVIVDLRRDSPTYLQHFGIELCAENHKAVYVPPLFAHGHQTLSDGAEIFYLAGGFYTPGCERGLRYDDPVLGIRWPEEVTLVSDKDTAWNLLEWE